LAVVDILSSLSSPPRSPLLFLFHVTSTKLFYTLSLHDALPISIIAYSVPALVFIYPITIILVLLTLSQNVFNWTTAIYRGAVLFTALVSLYDGLKEFGYSLPTITPFMDKLPLAHVGLGWLFPSIVGAVIGGVIGYMYKKK